MSRPTKLTPELQAEICGYIENGNTFTRACALSGISEPSFYLWKSLGEKDIDSGKETEYSEFLEAIKRAEEKFKAWNIQQIMNAGKQSNHWQACAWLLERKYPGEFGRKERVEHSGTIVKAKESPEERAQRIKELLDKRER